MEPRLPATLHEGRGPLGRPDPPAINALPDGERYREVPSHVGGVKQRWWSLYADARQPRLKRTVDKELARQSDK